MLIERPVLAHQLTVAPPAQLKRTSARVFSNGQSAVHHSTIFEFNVESNRRRQLPNDNHLVPDVLLDGVQRSTTPQISWRSFGTVVSERVEKRRR
jgi:hypothetical protein